MDAPLNEVFGRALLRAANVVAPESGDRSFLEKRLAACILRALEPELPGYDIVLARKVGGFAIPHWDPQPGWLDLAVVVAQQPVGVAEIKLDDVDQTLWDLFKVANTLERPTVRAAYLVVAAPVATWERKGELVELFSGASEEWYSRFLFEEYASSWKRLLRDGKGRPTAVPRVIFTTPVVSAPVENFPPYELRAITIGKTAEWLPIIDGWPPVTVDENEIADDELQDEGLPAHDAPEQALHEFALTTNGYERMGSSARCGALANAAFDAWRNEQRLPLTLRELRCCLFFEQRRWHHYGYGFDDETLAYVRELVEAIRERVSGRPV